MPPSIRGRLTLWLSLLITLCMIAFALFLYLTVRGALTGDLERTLRVQAQQVAASFDFGGLEAAADGSGQHVDISAVDQFATAGLFVETFDARGRLLARSSNLGRLSLPGVARAAALVRATPDDYATEAVPGGEVRVYSMAAVRGGHTVGLVRVAASLDVVTRTTQTLLGLLVAGTLGLVLLVILGSGVAVRWGLRPLEQMATVTEGITAHHLDQRLILRNPPAEVARLAATFDAMLDRLDAAFATQRRFVADASHDLRTPLATLHGRSEVLLLNSDLDAETRAGLLLIRAEAARLGRLVANLLLLARGDEGQPLDRRPVDLDVLLLEVAHQARAQAQGVTVTLGHEDQAQVLGNADLLKQALLNLVDNALTYTPPGGQVVLSLTVSTAQVQVAVRDSGPGIAPDDVEHIFERFYRTDQARSRHSGGAGLGLSIVRWIAEAHGGRVTVKSVVGAGSTFTLVLPISNRSLTVP